MSTPQTRRKLVAGNWKMHGSRPGNAELLAGVLAGRPYGADVAVCVPAVFLTETAATLAASDIRWGAQDVSPHEQGAYTGEVSAAMLRELAHHCSATALSRSMSPFKTPRAAFTSICLSCPVVWIFPPGCCFVDI